MERVRSKRRERECVAGDVKECIATNGKNVKSRQDDTRTEIYNQDSIIIYSDLIEDVTME